MWMRTDARSIWIKLSAGTDTGTGRDMLVSCVVLWFWVDSMFIHVKDEVKVHVMRWIQADAYV
jgi:hypothetical protein